jgi:ubiquinone/menaquinone biosynthesis C-methylase UbiE
MDLAFADESFDLVCAFAALHHIRERRLAISEMLRVARRGIFISDVNIYGQGSFPVRMLKGICYRLRLWPIAFFLKTCGRNCNCSEADGISYSYSVFDDLSFLRQRCSSVHPIATRNASSNLLFSASHAAVLCIKNGPKLL